MSDDTILLDQDLEDRFFKALLHYEKLLPLIKDRVKGENFSTTNKSKLYKLIVNYYSEIGSLPDRDVLEYEIKNMYKGTSGSQVVRYLSKLEKIPVPNWDWIVLRIDEWIGSIVFHKSLYEAAEKLKEGKFTLAKETVLSSVKNQSIINEGGDNDLEITNSDLQWMVSEHSSLCCKTGIHALDDVVKGLYRKELFVVMAPLNVGKSWAAIQLAMEGLIEGKHVLYLTLEMAREKVLCRVIQNSGGFALPRSEDDVEREIKNWDENFEFMEETKAKSILDFKQVQKQLEILRSYGGKLSVRSYPSNTCSLGDIEREISLFDAKFNKTPDLVIVDGLTDLKFTGGVRNDNQQRNNYSYAVKELRRMADQEDLAMVVTHQANRAGLSADVVDATHTGESLGILQVADTAISLNQNKSENEQNKMRIYLVRARNKQKWQMVECWQNLEIGQFCQHSRVVDPDEDKDDEE